MKSMVIISNGFGRFILSETAEEVDRRDQLSAYFTGAYPTPLVQRMTSALGSIGRKKVARLLGRGGTYPDRLVTSFYLPEALSAVGVFIRQFGGPRVRLMTNRMNRLALKWYGRKVAERIRKAVTDVSIYHYRAGFGGVSVKVAKDRGMVTICDHSIVHPDLLHYFAEHNGQWPEKGKGGPIDLLWTYIKADIEQADYVLVNSQFVKDTFLHMGWNPAKVQVLYLGVDDSFVSGISVRHATPANSGTPPLLVFAGNFGTRKGADILVAALRRIDDIPWRLEIIGSVERSAKTRHEAFLADPRVQVKGIVPRDDLANRLVAADLFVFPSFAEGSARVIFEALACGCYVITTPNSGSIVEDEIHGAIVPPGDVAATETAIRYALTGLENSRRFGKRNAELVSSEFTQTAYGDKLTQICKRILQEKNRGLQTL